MNGRELKAKLRTAGIAGDFCRWIRFSPDTTLGQIYAEQGKPLGYWAISLPRGEKVHALVLRVLTAEGIDVNMVQFVASKTDFSDEERKIIDAGGSVSGWTR